MSKELKFTKKYREQKRIKGITYETDHQGKWKVIEQTNGIKVRLLREPSEEYKKKMQTRKEAQKIKDAEKKVKMDREKLINEKMRELAIKQLEKEGKL